MIVNFYGYVDVYAPQGKIGFTITQIDVAGPARATSRADARSSSRACRPRDSSRPTRRVPLSPVPLRVGLVASPGHRGLQRLHRAAARTPATASTIALVQDARCRARPRPPRSSAAIETLDRARRRHHLRRARRRFQGRPRVLRRRARRAGDRARRRRRSSPASATPVTSRSPTSSRTRAPSRRPSSARRSSRSWRTWHQRNVRLPAQRVLDAPPRRSSTRRRSTSPSDVGR